MKNNSLEESNVDKVRRQREEKKVWKKPLPPSPFLMHLNVIARTQYIEEYMESKNTIKNECAKFLDTSLGNAPGENTAARSNEETSESILSTKDEKQALDFVMSDLIRNLVSDKSFQSLILKLKDEPIPYFFQVNGDEVGTITTTSKGEDSSRTKSSGDDLSVHSLKSSPEFGSMIENLLENTLSNILTEAFNREFSLTSRPRLIALPPKSSQGQMTTTASTANLAKRTATPVMDARSLITPVSPTLSVTKSVDMISNIIKNEPLF
jgi:hypothetical protein